MVDVAGAFVWACTLDVAARKPGNVSLASAGHRMQAQQFIGSAQAAAPAIAGTGTGPRVGRRIEAAMRATLAAVGCNTNLGIVLLCAPLAVAAEAAAAPGAQALRQALLQVLDGLDLADAQAAFRAIALTQPAGLGQVAQQDVHAPPSVGLRAAMALAAGRDSVARQYDAGYADLFDLGLGWFGAAAGPPEIGPAAGLPGSAGAMARFTHCAKARRRGGAHCHAGGAALVRTGPCRPGAGRRPGLGRVG